MPARILFLVSLFFSFFQACAPVMAKRLAPDPVKAVTHAGLRYEAPIQKPIEGFCD